MCKIKVVIMMKKIIDKRNYIILIIIIILLIWLIFFNKKEAYLKSFNYFDEVITYEVYENVNHKELTNDIKEIYESYKSYKKDLKKKNLSENMKSLKEYSKLVNLKTDNLVEDNVDDIIASYVTNEVIYYFKQNNIKKYIVNENGNVTVGKHYNNSKYKISINNYILNLENKSVATYKNITVISNDNLTADMLSKTLNNTDYESGIKLLKKYKSYGLWIEENKMSKGFKKYINIS